MTPSDPRRKAAPPKPDVRPPLVVPPDLGAALAADPAAKAAFDALAYTHRREHIAALLDAKKPETRQRRLEKTIAMLRSDRPTRSNTVSTRPTVEKMRIRGDQHILLLGADRDAVRIFDAVPEGCIVEQTAGRARYDVVVLFAETAADLAKGLPRAMARCDGDSALWIAYPKQTSGRATTLTRDSGWEPTRRADLSTVTMIALDDVWAGVRYRVSR